MNFDTQIEQSQERENLNARETVTSLIEDIYDIDSNSPQILTKRLFGLKRNLLELVYENQEERTNTAKEFRNAIFSEKENIASLFKKLGGNLHQETAKLFNNLQNADDLAYLAIAPKKRQKIKDNSLSSTYARPGFYVFSKQKIAEEQSLSLKNLNPLKRKGKQGKEIPINTVSRLFRINNNNRPIYITTPMSNNLNYLLKLFSRIRPDCVHRTFHANWKNGKYELSPLKNIITQRDELGETEKKVEDKLTTAARKFFLKNPEPGEIYLSRVEVAKEDSCFVELLPGVYSELKTENGKKAIRYNNGDIIQEEDTLIVKVKDVEPLPYRVYNDFINSATYESVLTSIPDAEPEVPATERNFLLGLSNVLKT